MAESYLQHAEHYFRLIASAQQAQQQSAYGYQRTAGEQAEADEDDGDDDFSSLPDRFASPAERVVTPAPQPAAQPYAERQPYSNGGDRPAYESRQERSERYERQTQGQSNDRQPAAYQDRQAQPDRQETPRYDNRQDRGDTRQDYQRQDNGRQENTRQENTRQDNARQDNPRQDGQRYDNRSDRNGRSERPAYADRSFADRGTQERNGQERNGQDRNGPDRSTQDRPSQERSPNRDFDNRGNRNRGQRDFRGETGQPREARQPDVEPVINALPAFITAPVRVQPEPAPAAEPIAAAIQDAPAAVSDTGDDVAGFAMRPRRRRRAKADFVGAEGETAPESQTTDPVGE